MITKHKWDLNAKRVLSIKRILTPIFVDIITYTANERYASYKMIYIFGVRVFVQNVSTEE